MAALTVVALTAVGAELALAYREPVAAPADWEAEANAALVTRFYAEVWTGGRTTRVAHFVAADHVYHDPTNPDMAPGPAGVVEVVTALRRAFPDLVLTLADVVATGDRVAVRITARGTHRGAILGAEATERAVTVTGVAILRVVDRQIAETWISWDTFDLALHVGLVMVPISTLDWEGAPSGERSMQPH
jgi:steroid delta-isomerase-like uncharacterized protein